MSYIFEYPSFITAHRFDLGCFVIPPVHAVEKKAKFSCQRGDKKKSTILRKKIILYYKIFTIVNLIYLIMLH